LWTAQHISYSVMRKQLDRIVRLVKNLTMALVAFLMLYQAIAWTAFQWRNPLSNEMSFYRNFLDVITWKKLPEYQP